MRVDTAAWNRARYDLYAPVYDWAVARLGVLARGRRRALELAGVRDGERVLLVAAGTGLDLPLLPPGAAITAVDISPAMLARLTARARSLGRTVHAEVMDAARLAFPDATFDCVVLHLALAVVPDPVATIREAARVLRPTGRVSIFDKFLPEGAEPSLVRRAASAVARVVATDLNRRLEPLLDAAALARTHAEPIGPGGLFVAVRAERA